MICAGSQQFVYQIDREKPLLTVQVFKDWWHGQDKSLMAEQDEDSGNDDDEREVRVLSQSDQLQNIDFMDLREVEAMDRAQSQSDMSPSSLQSRVSALAERKSALLNQLRETYVKGGSRPESNIHNMRTGE